MSNYRAYLPCIFGKQTGVLGADQSKQSGQVGPSLSLSGQLLDLGTRGLVWCWGHFCVPNVLQHIIKKLWFAIFASWYLGILASWHLKILVSWHLGILASWHLGILASWHLGILAPCIWHHSLGVSHMIVLFLRFQGIGATIRNYWKIVLHVRDFIQCCY